MTRTTNKPWLRLIRATGYSLAGLRTTFNNEPAFRQELLVLLLVIPSAFWLGENGVEYALLIGSWLLVIMVELLAGQMPVLHQTRKHSFFDAQRHTRGGPQGPAGGLP